ncbi:XRE family transcriptional regulator [Nocardia blacklockiae]|nr:XRE family transcriptional regulator [Nocardia blacklockiae]
MTLQQGADYMEWGKTTLQNLETARSRKVRTHVVKELCELYGCDATKTAALTGLARQIPSKSWWHAYGDLIPASFNLYLGLEAGARELTLFQPSIVPGLLQTPEYARTLDRQYFPEETEEEIDRRVQVRIQRQSILTRKRRSVKLTIAVHEAALRTVVGSRKVMAQQMRHLADISTRDNVSIRILPYTAGFPYGMALNPFVILDFPDDVRGRPVEPTLVFAESFIGGMYFERKTDVRAYREAFEKVWQACMDEPTSRTMVREMAREYDRAR